ncbi:hypothetical protein CL652_02340 [bacterium]|nr:hypothetical protein [bacterium]
MLLIIHKNAGLSTRFCYHFFVRKLRIITWNLGIGAFGAEADISYEGGRNFIPSSRDAISKNVAGIQRFLASSRADVYLLQELTSGSFLNKWYNIRKTVHAVLNRYHSASISNFSLPLFFDFLRNEHGMGTYVTKAFRARKRFAKQFKAGEYFYRIIPRWDYALTTFVKRGKGKPIALINTHLSSFDKHGLVRISQFQELMGYVKRLNRRGHPVVVGADWNMHNGDVNYCSEDKEYYKYYVRDFPHHLIPQGWSANFPENAPTLRAGNRPYEKNSSTTAFVDGFVCSPEVRTEYVKTIDLNFEHSDHNPVEIVVYY